LSHASTDLKGVTMTFLGAGAADVPSHVLLASIAATDPGRAQRIQAGLTRLIAQDDAVMKWMEADPAHAAQFAADPIAALHAALPDLPADFFDAWRGAE
jgi:hypothetical protein